jgi:excisionase family DNA binding protein
MVSLLKNLAALVGSPTAFPFNGGPDSGNGTDDLWLNHAEAADYLGISKSTLYQYACRRKIESRKLGGRLEYRRSTLEQFKDHQIRPAHRCFSQQSIISTTLNSGK